MPKPSFALSEEEAEARYQKYKTLDPLPSIIPALLNGAQLADYVAATGLIHPFMYDKDVLKPASYEVPLGGDYVYWDNVQGSVVEGELKEGDEFWLNPNSLVFLTLAPMFRVPQYLALRFNLRITHVYRGLLVGTGPLVDPGFHGHLHLPLHNLTANRYRLVGGEGLIWVEVTKTQPVQLAEKDLEPRVAEMFDLPDAKKNLTLRQYLRKADPNNPIRSSIPQIQADVELRLNEAQAAVGEALGAVRQVQRREVIGAVIGVIAVFFALIGTLLVFHQIIDATNARVDATNTRIDQVVQQARSSPTSSVDQQISQLNSRLCRLEPPAQQARDNCPTPSPSP
jgi:deoxycytidine triphosphate deaminase